MRWACLGRTEGANEMDERLRDALEGVELTEREERYLEWLSRMDSETVEVFAGLFERTREAGRIEGHKKSTPREEGC